MISSWLAVLVQYDSKCLMSQCIGQGDLLPFYFEKNSVSSPCGIGENEN